jgi:hypothetical protein
MTRGKTIGIYFRQEDPEYEAIKKEAANFRLTPTEYARRLLFIGRAAVKIYPEAILQFGDVCRVDQTPLWWQGLRRDRD